MASYLVSTNVYIIRFNCHINTLAKNETNIFMYQFMICFFCLLSKKTCMNKPSNQNAWRTTYFCFFCFNLKVIQTVHNINLHISSSHFATYVKYLEVKNFTV
jgi:hypothetical protein